MSDQVGALRERLVIQQNVWPIVPVTSITRSSTTATVTTATAHGFVARDRVRVAGATPSGYTGLVSIAVTSDTTFTYPVDGTLTTPATGTITVVYDSDAQGGRREHWTTLATLPAAMTPLTAQEKFQAAAVQAIVTYQFRVRVRTDLSPTMRAQWTPSWPRGAAVRSLQINGILPVNDGTRYQILQCAEVAT